MTIQRVIFNEYILYDSLLKLFNKILMFIAQWARARVMILEINKKWNFYYYYFTKSHIIY